MSIFGKYFTGASKHRQFTEEIKLCLNPKFFILPSTLSLVLKIKIPPNLISLSVSGAYDIKVV